VNKPLNLKGESRENTLIDWEGAESTIEVIADNVSISNFMVQRSPNM
jgi:hypothetical protein